MHHQRTTELLQTAAFIDPAQVDRRELQPLDELGHEALDHEPLGRVWADDWDRVDDPRLAPPVVVGLFNATLYVFVTVFVFGTRLTNITRQLRHRDVDVAMAKVADAIKDVSGRGEIALDPFSGSGTTIIAAQKTVSILVNLVEHRGGRSGAGRGAR